MRNIHPDAADSNMDARTASSTRVRFQVAIQSRDQNGDAIEPPTPRSLYVTEGVVSHFNLEEIPSFVSLFIMEGFALHVTTNPLSSVVAAYHST